MAIQNKETTTAMHFDAISKDYDQFKKKAYYYYDHLKKVVKASVPNNLFTLEIGSGTGEMLSAVTNNGMGIDSSPEMVKLAQIKYPSLHFKNMAAEDLDLSQTFDVILMICVAEHVNDFSKTIRNIGKVSRKGTIVLITTVHPLYRPMMTYLGKIGLKMDEGKHMWVSVKEIQQRLNENNFKIIKSFNDLALPINIPLISHFVNNSILNKWFGLTQFVLAVHE